MTLPMQPAGQTAVADPPVTSGKVTLRSCCVYIKRAPQGRMVHTPRTVPPGHAAGFPSPSAQATRPRYRRAPHRPGPRSVRRGVMALDIGRTAFEREVRRARVDGRPVPVVAIVGGGLSGLATAAQ